MDQEVPLELTVGWEFFVTLITTVGSVFFRYFVDFAHVAIEIVFVDELFGTGVAVHGFLSRVTYDMDFKGAFGGEHFVAYFAHRTRFIRGARFHFLRTILIF